MNPQLEARLRFCKNLPTIPAVAMRVVELAARPDAGMPEVARLIGRDPALATKVLKVANSPLYGFRRKTQNLRLALNLLGLNAVISLALNFSLARALHGIKSQGFDAEHYWRRSVIAAVAARSLGMRLGVKDAEELLLAGLLQNIGMLAFNAVLPEDYGKLVAGRTNHDAIIAAERAAFGTDHAEAGAWLVYQRNLPAYLRRLVAGHEPNGAQGPRPIGHGKLCGAIRIDRGRHAAPRQCHIRGGGRQGRRGIPGHG